MADFKKDTTGYFASERVWTTRDGRIVRDGDYRAAQLLAIKGGLIPLKTGQRLGLDAARIEPLERAPKKVEAKPAPVLEPVRSAVVSAEDIEARSTRPEKISTRR